MALEDRIHSSVDTALTELTARLDQDFRALVQQLVTVAAEERDAAVTTARRAALDESAEDVKRQVDEAEARVRATIEEQIGQARDEERSRAAVEIRRLIETEADQKLSEALEAADARMKLALSDAEAKAEQRLKEVLSEARVRERESEMAAIARLLDSVRGLDGATTLSEVLDALGRAAGREAGRVAVLVLRNDRLVGWTLSGFGARDAQPKSVDVGLNEGGVVTVAVGTARPATTRDGPTAGQGPGFAHLPADRMGLAVPVIVGGRVVAVVYADGVSSDGSEQAVPSGWPETIEILARHAGRCLEALTAQKAVVPPSPRFWVPGARPGQAAGAPHATGVNRAPEPVKTTDHSDRPPGANA